MPNASATVSQHVPIIGANREMGQEPRCLESLSSFPSVYPDERTGFSAVETERPVIYLAPSSSPFFFCIVRYCYDSSLEQMAQGRRCSHAACQCSTTVFSTAREAHTDEI